ncbi:M56 family metallopeptidase [Paenibacillus agri]|uniref:M56 family metallopeptidase n=1 Tax=Paenibacillus agri TaxID=2744309 RepID=A0A850EKR1_9BACL|nr:M56 family metallopeptidase [Paenibacillus agri]NUU60976.1 M56 family metallopeptidase [Paenibacillus agri]
MNVVYSGFSALMESTIAASIVILLILLIQSVFRKALSARIRHLLWLLVIIRLLVPVFPESSLSIFHVLDYSRTFQEKLWHQSERAELETIVPSQQLSKSPLPQASITEEINAISPEEGELLPPKSFTETAAAGTVPLVLRIATIIWCIGMIVLLLNLLLFMGWMARLRKQLLPVSDSGVLAVLDEVRRHYKIARNIPLYTGHSTPSPYLSGLLRPWIYIPERAIREMNSAELYHILAHELAHYKRKDMLWNYLGSLAAAIHWPNPLIWVGMRRMKGDRELACDAYVLEKAGEEEAVAYGMTMISFLQRYSATAEPRGLLYFSNPRGRQELIRRITMIKYYKKGSYRISMITVLLIILLSAMTLTNASGSPISEPVKANDKLAEAADFIRYNRLDRIVKAADFTFEAPSVLPPGFQFAEGTLMRTKTSELFERVTLTFVDKRKGQQQQFLLEAGTFKGPEKMTDITIDNIKELYGKTTLEIEQKDLTIQGLKVRRINASIRGDIKDSSYLWERGGVSYRLNSRTAKLLEQEIPALIASMKLPDDKVKSSYINKDLLTVDVIQGEDLKLAAAEIGAAPKFPLQVSDFTVKYSFMTKKLNFSAKNASARVLLSQYESKASGNGGNTQGFTLLQVKDDGQFETFKANRQAIFNRIDGGGELIVPVSLASMNGMEVLITAPYNISPDLDPGKMVTERTSYFWLDSGVCYQVVFNTGQVKDRESVVAALIKIPPIQFKE